MVGGGVCIFFKNLPGHTKYTYKFSWGLGFDCKCRFIIHVLSGSAVVVCDAEKNKLIYNLENEISKGSVFFI